MANRDPAVRPSALELLHNHVLVPFIKQTDDELRKELEEQKLKNEQLLRWIVVDCSLNVLLMLILVEIAKLYKYSLLIWSVKAFVFLCDINIEWYEPNYVKHNW